MYLVSLSLLAHRHWRADMSMWCIELEIWLVEQRLPPNATATNWTGGNALQYKWWQRWDKLHLLQAATSYGHVVLVVAVSGTNQEMMVKF